MLPTSPPRRRSVHRDHVVSVKDVVWLEQENGKLRAEVSRLEVELQMLRDELGYARVHLRDDRGFDQHGRARGFGHG